MKKYHISFILFFLATITATAQNAGIAFRSIDKLEDVIATAKSESKDIFAYLHYEGCVYCPQMEKNVFSTDEVGTYYNDRFISLSLDIDIDSLGSYFASEYQLWGYPAYLYLDAEGNLQHRSVGYKTPKEFIIIAQDAFKETQNFAYFQQRISEGDLSAYNLRQYFSNGRVTEQDSLINTYLENCSPEKLYAEETWLLLKDATPYYSGTFFDYILEHEDEFRKTVGSKEVDDFLVDRWVFFVNQWDSWWVNDIQRNKRKRELKQTEHPLYDRVIRQVGMEVWIERAIRKASKRKLKKLVDQARLYYSYDYDDWYNYYKAAWVILSNAESISQDDLEFGYTLAKASVDIHKDFMNMFIYAYYCKAKGEEQKSIDMMEQSLQYATDASDPKYVKMANDLLDEWKNEQISG